MRRFGIGLSIMALAMVLSGASLAGRSDLSRPAGSGAFGAMWGGATDTEGVAIDVTPVTADLADGATETVYALPDGETIRVVTPPPGFDPLTADDATLAAYDFPARPSDLDDLADWTSAMADFETDEAPSGALHVEVDASAEALFTTYYSNWAGYIAGTLFTQSHTYVAVKGNLTVPTNTGTCSSSTSVGFWIGMGGTETVRSNDLVQQGVECGNSNVGTGSAWRPFTEFANTAHPRAFCGFTSWTLAPGDVIYQNMSFQTANNKAFFYLEDQTSGVAHSCSATPPAGWSWDLNSAEWIAEAPAGVAINFHSVHFSNTRAELFSNSSWVTLGSQPNNKTIQGDSSAYYCISPGSIGSDNASFTDTWHQADCYQ
jgi:hypothetical protein